MKTLSALVLASLMLLLGPSSPKAATDSLSGAFTIVNNKGQAFYVVYVTKPDGKFVKTLRIWGKPGNGFFKQMKIWPTLSNKNIVDAVTAATESNMAPAAKFGWNGKDTTKSPVARGPYNLVIESVRRNNIYHIIKVPFELDGTNKTFGHSDSLIWNALSFNTISTGATTALSDAPNNQFAYLNFGSTRINFPFLKNGSINFTVTALDGRKLIDQNILAHNGENHFVLQRPNLQAGIYLVRIQNDTFSKKEKVFYHP